MAVVPRSVSAIGENSAISNVERFHYLRACLQGPVEKLIWSLTVTGENYDRAWTILSKHYENKKELIRSNFAAFTVAKMKGDTTEELSRVHRAVTTAVNAQESIGRPSSPTARTSSIISSSNCSTRERASNGSPPPVIPSSRRLPTH